MSINLSSLPSMPNLDMNGLPSASDISEVLGDAFVTAVDTAGDAATVVADAAAVVAKSARRRPKAAGMIVGAALLAVLVAMFVARRRRSPAPLVATTERPADFVAA
jgi:hypothetical protein